MTAPPGSPLAIDRAGAALQRFGPPAIAALGALAIVSVGASRWLRDGSFWLDEAAIAINLLQFEPGELFGRLLRGHSFPRIYLIVLWLVSETFGFQTAVLRFLPFAFYVAASLLAVRLFYTRFRSAPLLLAFAIVLNLVPATWFTYSAWLKQYTLDVLLALVPFCLGDAFFERTLREGRGRWKLFAIAALCLASYTYVIALAGRVGGWVLAGLRERGLRFDPAAVAVFGGSLAALLLVLWFADVRYSATNPSLIGMWDHCILPGQWDRAPYLLDRFAFGWYDGRTAFAYANELPLPVIVLLKLGFAVGLVRLAVYALRGAERVPLAARAPDGWGSRSLGCACCLAGLLVASVPLSYPLCAGRLTLFALLPLQMVTLEGVDLAAGALARWRAGRVAAALALSAAVAVSLPPAWRNASRLATQEFHEDVRPLLHYVLADDIPILVSPCSTLQIQTLPELMNSPRVHYWDRDEGFQGQVPWGEVAWMIETSRSKFCRGFWTRTRRMAVEFKRYHRRSRSAALFRVRFPETPGS